MENKVNIEEIYRIIGRLYMDLHSIDKNYVSQIQVLRTQLQTEVEKRMQLEKQVNDKSGQRETCK